MKEEIKNLWIDALRSKKYKQGKGQLRNSNNEFCCLGVLCDISGKSEWIINYYFDETAELPKEVISWAGIKEDNFTGYIESLIKEKNSGYCYLSSLNDGGTSFNEIADLIEKYWEEL